jgi:hypothetical protein
MYMWNFKTPFTLMFSLIWNLSEWSGYGLGKIAPYVFERMIGRPGVKK